MEHDSHTSRLYKENWADAVRILNEKDARIAELEQALEVLAGVTEGVQENFDNSKAYFEETFGAHPDPWITMQ